MEFLVPAIVAHERVILMRLEGEGEPMTSTAYIYLGLAGLIVLMVAAFLFWRTGSDRRSLPCPTWLSWPVELDNPFLRSNRAGVIIWRR